jgi:hypothetical protein
MCSLHPCAVLFLRAPTCRAGAIMHAFYGCCPVEVSPHALSVQCRVFIVDDTSTPNTFSWAPVTLPNTVGTLSAPIPITAGAIHTNGQFTVREPLRVPPCVHTHPLARAPHVPFLSVPLRLCCSNCLFSLIHRSHSISFTRAQGIPKYKIGFARGKG